jgi:hypothetical protein
VLSSAQSPTATEQARPTTPIPPTKLATEKEERQVRPKMTAAKLRSAALMVLLAFLSALAGVAMRWFAER